MREMRWMARAASALPMAGIALWPAQASAQYPNERSAAYSPTNSPDGDLMKLSVSGTKALNPPSSIVPTTRTFPDG